ncbi:hypothetical protein FXB41_40790 [Bradyrhizobium canariense]|uniref:hypothetical protein n=1 Tax=Bradyrhizobium canariense TaxID=255045 RepID=UPI001CA5AD0C|nr:hypothetical protein [Bradyrhizobium canariense]MBW5440851.1 hypothetical protein [Bradyrhizobium canariense]
MSLAIRDVLPFSHRDYHAELIPPLERFTPQLQPRHCVLVGVEVRGYWQAGGQSPVEATAAPSIAVQQCCLFLRCCADGLKRHRSGSGTSILEALSAGAERTAQYERLVHNAG